MKSAAASLFVITIIIIIIIMMMIVSNGRCTSSSAKVAIIGSGPAGAITAYYLKNLIPDVEIDIYEHVQDEIDIYGVFTVHSTYSRYTEEIIRALDLEQYESNAIGKPVVYDGHNNRPLDVDKYYLSERNMLKPICDQVMKKFQIIYDLQQNKQMTFETVAELLSSISSDFIGYAKTTTKRFLQTKIKKAAFSNKVKSLVKAMIMYGPTAGLDANAFYGLMLLSFSELTGKMKLCTTENQKTIIPQLIGFSKAQMFRKKVVKITRQQFGGYYVSSINNLKDNDNNDPTTTTTDQRKRMAYEFVIIATNTANDIRFSKMQKPKFVEYADCYLTGIVGKLKKTCAGPQAELSEQIPSILDINKSFFILKLPAGMPADINYCITATRDVSKEEAEEYFEMLDDIPDHINMIRYLPKYSNNSIDHVRFVLAENLFNVKAIESAAPLLELLAISAKNIALLIKKKKTDGQTTDNSNPDLTKSLDSNFNNNNINVRIIKKKKSRVTRSTTKTTS